MLLTEAETLMVQPLASVTTTEKLPANKLGKFDDV